VPTERDSPAAGPRISVDPAVHEALSQLSETVVRALVRLERARATATAQQPAETERGGVGDAG
jgi:hypothetical protein